MHTCLSRQQKDLAEWIYALPDVVYALDAGSTWMSIHLLETLTNLKNIVAISPILLLFFRCNVDIPLQYTDCYNITPSCYNQCLFIIIGEVI